MTTASLTHPTMAAVLWPAAGRRGLARNLVLAVAGSLLLTVSAKIQIPFWPVPLTMQTFVVLVIGLAYGPRLGAATVALYLLEGAVGLPVFAGTPAKGIGLAYMAGPTGGYLAGFLVAAGLLGWLAERGWDRRVATTLAAMTIGAAVILVLGVAWLSTLIGFDAALKFGLVPFLPGEAAKILLATALLPSVWRLLARRA